MSRVEWCPAHGYPLPCNKCGTKAIMREERDATLHDILLEGRYCVTFTVRSGNTTSQTFKCYPTKLKAIRDISLFKHDNAWRQLADD